MRDQLIRAHALCKLLDLLDSELDLAKEERDDLYNTIADCSQESPLDRVYSRETVQGSDNRIQKTLVTLRDRLNVTINYIYMLEQLRNRLEEEFPAPAFKDLPF